MSVINRMLRDLQEQRPRLRVIEPEELRATAAPRVRTHRPFWVLVALAGLLLSAYLLWPRPDAPAIAASSSEQQPARSEPAVAPAAATAKIIRLDSLQIHEEKQRLRLDFQISAPTGIFLAEQTGRDYRFILREVRGGEQLPQLAGNDWLERLGVQQQQNGDLVVSLTTRPGVRVATDTRSQPGQALLWRLSLQQEAAPAGKIVAAAASPPPAEVTPDPTTPPIPAPATRAVSGEDKRGEPVRAAPGDTADAASTPDQATAPPPAPRKIEIRASKTPRPEPRLEQRQAAYRLFRSGDYRSLIERFGQDPAQDDLLALACQRLGRHEQAVLHYRRLLQREPDQARHWLGLAMSLEQLREHAAAQAAYRRARSLGGLSPRLDDYARQRLQQLAASARAIQPSAGE